VVNEHSFILIRQMAALVRCAWVDVCTAPNASRFVCKHIPANMRYTFRGIRHVERYQIAAVTFKGA